MNKAISMKKTAILAALAAVGALAVSGCKSREPQMPQQFGDLTADMKREFAATAPAPPLAGTKRDLRPWTREQLIAQAGVSTYSRNNPFALFPQEVSFQKGIRLDRIISQLPGYSLLIPAPPAPNPPELIAPEAQPYRRLSGVYFGETVSALIEMDDGKTYLVSPGDRVGETEWYVESIDSEKATLVREGKKIPKRIFVRLETPPMFTPDTGGGGGGDQGGGGGRGRGGGAQPAPMGGGGIGN